MSARKVLFGVGVLAMLIWSCGREPVDTTEITSVNQAVSGAVYTTVNKQVDKGNHCKNGNPPVNCNHYDGKEYVWLNGGPDSGGLKTDGTYFFAVLAPGGQPDPNDGGAKNLSDDFDAYTNRTFTVAGGEIVTYTGTHDFDLDPKRPTIRLFPYADTTNPGGVYIMAVCNLDGGYPVKPSNCKYDAFKVQKGKPDVELFMGGLKYRDDNKSGTLDEGVEVGLEGWTITIKGDNGVDTSVTTDSDGVWEWHYGPNKAESTFTTYTICEVQQANWRQTGNIADQSMADAGATVTLDATTHCYTVVVDNNQTLTVYGLYFGNIPQGEISGGKYYDSNKNGQFDPGEVGIAGWQIQQAGASSAIYVTAADGSFGPVALDPGTYTVTELQAAGWEQTGNTVDQFATTGGAAVVLAGKVYILVIPEDQPSTVTGLYFGNVCTVTPGGHTLGFWQNPNGQLLINDDDLTALGALCLRNADGSDYDPPTKEDLGTWLLDGNAVNMANMLSVQLTATTLSSRHGITNTAVIVDGTMTVDDLMTYANSLLCADGYTPSLDPNRIEQARVKGILDDINNNKSFPQPGPEYCPAPVF